MPELWANYPNEFPVSMIPTESRGHTHVQMLFSMDLGRQGQITLAEWVQVCVL